MVTITKGVCISKVVKFVEVESATNGLTASSLLITTTFIYYVKILNVRVHY